MITDEKEFEQLTGRKPVSKPDPMMEVIKAMETLAKAITETVSQQKPPVVNMAPIEFPKIEVASPAISKSAPKRWVFHVERDADNRLSKIIATPE